MNVAFEFFAAWSEAGLKDSYFLHNVFLFYFPEEQLSAYYKLYNGERTSR